MQNRFAGLHLIAASLILPLSLLPGRGGDDGITFPDFATADTRVMTTLPGPITVYNGGFGSGMAAVPGTDDQFYLLTDRGPNTDTSVANQKRFVDATFAPQIGHFRLDGNSLRLVRTITLKDAAGNNISGLPNPAGQGGTGKSAVDQNGNALALDPNGLDTEGLVALSDGTFWIADEYGPHIVHFDANGRTIEKINPFGVSSGGRQLPEVFKKRRANRGMEGLTATPDGRTLVGMMQSPLDNPSSAIRATSKAIRIVTIDLQTNQVRQFVYLVDAPGLLVSEISALSATQFLVLERDGNYPGGTPAATVKKIHKINIAGATDISDPANGVNGKLYAGKTVEQLTDAEMTANGITSVTKSLVYDLLTIPGFAHDKPEAVMAIGNMMIAVANDDDFGVTDSGTGSAIVKALPGAGNVVDSNRIYFIRLSQPLL